MIAYLKGKILTKDENSIILDVKDTGYQVFLDNRSLETLPAVGAELTVYTYQHVREDALVLYGFRALPEKRLFLALLSVSGIGPKSALAFLSAYTVEELVGAIYRSDLNSFSQISGVGRKTAEKVVVELKDKILKLFPEIKFTGQKSINKQGTAGSRVEENYLTEIRGALKSLGYNGREIEDVLQKNLDKISETTSVEEALRILLKNF